MDGAIASRKITANRRRGEIVVEIDGHPRILCLTLGALAELEDAFEVSNLSELGNYFAKGKFSSEDLIRIIGAGLRGGGNLYTNEDVRCLSIEGGAVGLAKVASDLLTVTFSAPNASDEAQDADQDATVPHEKTSENP